MIPTGQDSLKTRSTLTVGGASFAYYDLGDRKSTRLNSSPSS